MSRELFTTFRIVLTQVTNYVRKTCIAIYRHVNSDCLDEFIQKAWREIERGKFWRQFKNMVNLIQQP